VLFPTGNVVYLAGNGRGKEIRLSSLIGLSIYSISAEVDAKKKTLTGKWVSGPHLAWRETFKASRTSDFDVEVSVKTAKRDQTLSMPQLAGYAGKPLIVEVGGSWCDACKHAAEALRDIYGRYHDRGLEIVSLTYEFTDDTAYNKRQAETFKKTYQIPWEVISVDGDTEKAWEVIPQGIEGVDASAFPLTLFVRRDGTIHAIHASFAGPENAKEHKRWVEEYERGAAAIVGGKSASK
jgi:thiol-disulfide isomerase/thioredoxin